MKIVFVINSLTHFHIFHDYIKKLSDLKVYEIHSILVKPELGVKELELKKISNVISLYQVKAKEKIPLKEESPKVKRKRFLFYFFYFFYLFWKHTKIYKNCTTILNSIQPDFVFVSSERYTTFDLFFAKACKKRHIKTGVLGIDFFYVDTFDTYLRSEPQRKIKTYAQKITALLFPKQVFFVNSNKCLYYPVHLTWNLFLMNTLPTRPYLTGSRFIDQIHVDSEYTKAKYIQHGVNEKLIKVTGLLEHDLIARSLQKKENIKSEFSLDPLKKTVILAVPQGFEHHLVSREEHFEIIHRLISGILKYPVNLILSLHPKMDLNNYIFLESEYPLQISKISLREFITVSDIFIATYSSTVLWSTLLNIPCLVFDFYQLNYNCYNELKNVTRTKGFDEFEEKLDIIFANLNAFNQSSNFGDLDGNVFNRFLKHLE